MKFATTLLKDAIKQVRMELLVISVSLTVILVSHSVTLVSRSVTLVSCSVTLVSRSVTLMLLTASTHTEILDILLTQASDNLIALYDGKILVQALVLEWEYP